MSKQRNPQPSDVPAAVSPNELVKPDVSAVVSACETIAEAQASKRFLVALKHCPDAVVEAKDADEAFERYKAMRSIKRSSHKPIVSEVA